MKDRSDNQPDLKWLKAANNIFIFVIALEKRKATTRKT
jgi:hypothetical protein